MNINENDLDLTSNNRFVQFQLWRDCDIGCEFCHNKGVVNCNSKIDNIRITIDLIKNNPTVQKYNEIGLIGGELFGKQLKDPKVKKEFLKLIKLIVSIDSFEKVYIGGLENTKKNGYDYNCSGSGENHSCSSCWRRTIRESDSNKYLL